MRIATDYEIDSNTGKIIRPGEIIFDEVSIDKQENNINKQLNLEENTITETGGNADINENNKENIEQETEDNTAVKNKKLRKSGLPEIN